MAQYLIAQAPMSHTPAVLLQLTITALLPPRDPVTATERSLWGGWPCTCTWGQAPHGLKNPAALQRSKQWRPNEHLVCTASPFALLACRFLLCAQPAPEAWHPSRRCTAFMSLSFSHSRPKSVALYLTTAPAQHGPGAAPTAQAHAYAGQPHSPLLAQAPRLDEPRSLSLTHPAQ